MKVIKVKIIKWHDINFSDKSPSSLPLTGIRSVLFHCQARDYELGSFQPYIEALTHNIAPDNGH